MSVIYIIYVKGENDPCVYGSTVNLRVRTLEPKNTLISQVNGKVLDVV